jgi:hypothetical protein
MPGVREVRICTHPTQRRSNWAYCAAANVFPNQMWCAFTVVENELCCPVGTEIARYSVGPVLKPKLDELLFKLRIGTSTQETTASVCAISSSYMLLIILLFRPRSLSYWHLHLITYKTEINKKIRIEIYSKTSVIYRF